MSKYATKAAGNMFCQARYEAAKFNERLGSREGAAEELGVDRTRLARIELGSVTPYPEEVLLMADIYRAPELKGKAVKGITDKKAYDNLYDLQESEDCVYYSSGARTKQVIQDYFKKWGIPIGKYTGPDVVHGVIKEDKKKLGTMVKDILDEAKKKGGGYSAIRSVKGKAQILAIGSNKNIYHFAETENLISVSHKRNNPDAGNICLCSCGSNHWRVWHMRLDSDKQRQTAGSEMAETG